MKVSLIRAYVGSSAARIPGGLATALVLICTAMQAHADNFSFQNIINPADPTFNQELGINNSGLIAGYFGSGAAGHPNQGYTTAPPYTSFTSENFPGSVQTQVTGLNNPGTTVGFWSETNMGAGTDNNFGFVKVNGSFTNVNNPNTPTGVTPVFNQLLGVNDSNIAVGFYTDAAGLTHGYTYNIGTMAFSGNIDDPNAVNNTTAAAINNSDAIAGFYMDAGGATHGFIEQGGVFTTLDAPGATNTSLLGLNNQGEAVGFDMDAAGLMHGIVCNVASLTCVEVDDPNGIGTTTFNGVNDKGQIVGFYGSGANTIGLVATPLSATPEPSSLTLFACGVTLLGAAYFRRRRTA